MPVQSKFLVVPAKRLQVRKTCKDQESTPPDNDDIDKTKDSNPVTPPDFDGKGNFCSIDEVRFINLCLYGCPDTLSGVATGSLRMHLC
jgi:hypothetical protein